jgi:hypothetical protein
LLVVELGVLDLKVLSLDPRHIMRVEAEVVNMPQMHFRLVLGD